MPIILLRKFPSSFQVFLKIIYGCQTPFPKLTLHLLSLWIQLTDFILLLIGV